MRDGAVGAFGIPVAFRDEEQTGRGEIAECSIGKLRERKIGIVERAEHVGEHRDGAGDVGGEVGRFAESGSGSVDGDVDAFGLLGAELEFAGDEGAVWLGRGAFESVEEAPTGERRGSGSFAGAGDGDVVGNVEMERGAVAVRGIVGEREPARGEKEVCAFLADDGGAEAGDGTVILIGEEAGVVEGEMTFVPVATD